VNRKTFAKVCFDRIVISKSLFLLLLVLPGYSQEPDQAVEICGGLSSGFEYRVFTDNLNSYKVLLSKRLSGQGMQLTDLKEFHVPDAFDIGEKLSFVMG